MLLFNINKPLTKEDIDRVQNDPLAREARNQRFRMLFGLSAFLGFVALIGGLFYVFYVGPNIAGDAAWLIPLLTIPLLFFSLSYYARGNLPNSKSPLGCYRRGISIVPIDFQREMMTKDPDPAKTLSIVKQWPAARLYVDQVAAQGRKLTCFEANGLAHLAAGKKEADARTEAEAELYGAAGNSVLDGQGGV